MALSALTFECDLKSAWQTTLSALFNGGTHMAGGKALTFPVCDVVFDQMRGKPPFVNPIIQIHAPHLTDIKRMGSRERRSLRSMIRVISADKLDGTHSHRTHDVISQLLAVVLQDSTLMQTAGFRVRGLSNPKHFHDDEFELEMSVRTVEVVTDLPRLVWGAIPTVSTVIKPETMEEDLNHAWLEFLSVFDGNVHVIGGQNVTLQKVAVVFDRERFTMDMIQVPTIQLLAPDLAEVVRTGSMSVRNLRWHMHTIVPAKENAESAKRTADVLSSQLTCLLSYAGHALNPSGMRIVVPGSPTRYHDPEFELEMTTRFVDTTLALNRMPMN